jgi:hypothetical protein
MQSRNQWFSTPVYRCLSCRRLWRWCCRASSLDELCWWNADRKEPWGSSRLVPQFHFLKHISPQSSTEKQTSEWILRLYKCNFSPCMHQLYSLYLHGPTITFVNRFFENCYTSDEQIYFIIDHLNCFIVLPINFLFLNGELLSSLSVNA